jgi:hypothetical protein
MYSAACQAKSRACSHKKCAAVPDAGAQRDEIFIFFGKM